MGDVLVSQALSASFKPHGGTQRAFQLDLMAW